MIHGSKSTNPFPGLRAFRQDEDYLFFGREEQTIELLRRLGGNRFVTVVGTSGSGKSSLVRCGLLSELLGGKMLQAGASWEVAVTHPGGNPLAILTDALLDADLYDREVENTRENLLATLSRSHFGLVEAVRQSGIGGETNFLLVVDQFEEIFRFRDAGETQQEAAAEFVSLLLQAVAQREVPVYVVLTMRSDFIGECSQFEGLSEMVNQGEFLIPRLTREQYKRVIEGPVKVAGGKIAPRLLQRLLNDLGQQADQLPCLQHALMRTWDVWSESGEARELDLEDYRRVGGMAEALSLHADEIYGALGSDQEREWCRGLFEALTVKESENRGIRRPQRLASLCEILEVPFEQLVPVIDAFRRPGVTFLMPSPEVELTESTIIDISHESLMRVWTRLRQWVEEEAQAAGIYVRLAESAMLHAEGKAGLYRDPELGIALSWIDRAKHPNQAWAERYRHGFSEAMSFLRASQDAAEAGEREKEAARQREVAHANALAKAERLRAEEHDQGARRLRKLLAAAAVIALLAIGASVFAAIQTGKARKSEAAADTLASQLKTSLVQGDFNNSFEKLNSGDAAASLAYLARATRTSPSYTPAGMRALSTLSSGRLPVQRFAPIEHKKPIETYLHNTKHDVLLTASEGGREVYVWSMDTGLQLNPLEGRSGEGLQKANAAATPDAVLAVSKEKLAGAQKIWLAGDPAEPPREPRYFRKSISIPTDRTPVRGDIFLLVDDEFQLYVNGALAGAGNHWETTYHLGLPGTSLTDGLELSLRAQNTGKAASVIAAVILTFENGEPLVVTSDRSWQSSTQEEEGFTDSKEWAPTKRPGPLTAELSGDSLSRLQWSADEDRVIGWSQTEGKIISWDVTSGKRIGKAVETKGMKDLDISAYDEQGDLAGCSYTDGSIRVWNLKTGEAATPRLKAGGNVKQWSFTPDGKRVIGLFSDALLVAWDVTGGTEVARISTRPVRPVGMQVSHDGRFVLTWDESRKQVAWWEVGVAGGTGELTWITLPFAADDMRFPASGDVVSFIGSGDKGTVRARSFALTGDRKQVADITSNPSAIRMADMRSRTHGIVGAVTANVVMLWDLRTGEAFPHPLVAPELLATANLSQDGRRLIAGSATQGATTTAAAADKKLFVFDIFTGQLVFPRPIVLQASSSITFSPDGETLVTMDRAANRTGFWDLRTGREIRAPIPGYVSGVVFFSRSGKRVALYQAHNVQRGTLELGQTTGRFFLHEAGFSPAAPEYLVERSFGTASVWAPLDGGGWLTWDWPRALPSPRIQLWDAEKSVAVRTIPIEVDPKLKNVDRPVKWSADGRRMIFVNDENSAAVVEVSSGKILTEIKCGARVYGTAISGDGSVAACGTGDGSVHTWAEDGTRTKINPFPGQDGIRYLVFNAPGSLLAVADDTKRMIGVVDPRTGASQFEPRTMVNITENFVFTPDGRYVIVSQLDAKIPMLDLKSGEVVREFEIGDWSRGLDLSADGRILAVGSGANLSATSGLAYLFDVGSGKMLTPPLPHAGIVLMVSLSADGTILVTTTHEAGGSASFQLWDVATGLPLTDPAGERGNPGSIAIQPDNSAVAVGWSNGVVQTVAIPPRTPAPAWFPELAEAIGGRRLAAETGTLENVPDAELAALRKKVLAADSVYAANADWFKWVQWLFEAPESRTISPGAKTTTAKLMERLRASNFREDLHQAVRLAPNDALTFARLASSYQTENPADAGAARRHREDTVVWFSDRSIKLAPQNPEVWTMRGELMRKLGRSAPAAEAAARVLALTPGSTDAASPNTLYQKALALGSQGKWEEAQAAYDGAIALLDDYVKRIEAGQQPLPLLGNLGRLLPTRVAAAKTDPAAEGAHVLPAISKEPIPGTLENFNGVAPGALPPGWRVWNQSDPGSRPGVHHAAEFQSDPWKDWTVIDRRQLEWGDDSLRKRILMEETGRQKLTEDGSPPLMNGRFALALSSYRRGEQIQYLESPDFDCSGRKDVHLAFNSAWEQDDLRMGMLEYSLDRGKTWKPVVYFVHKPLLDEAKKKYAETKKDPDVKNAFDVAAFLNEERVRFPWRLDSAVPVHRGRMAAFTVPVDTPGLAACIEGRNKGDKEYKRREIRALPGADGAATVRLRFGSVSDGHAFWGIDDVGLYEGDNAANPVVTDAGAGSKKDLKRPADDPGELTNLASEFLGGPRASEGAAPTAAPLMAAMARLSAGDTGNPTPGSRNQSAGPRAPNFVESRLLVTRARKLAPANRQLRIFAAFMEIAGLEAIATDKEAILREADPYFARVNDVLLNSSDLAADVRDPVWRAGYSMATVLRGMVASQKGDRESGITLLAVAEANAPPEMVAMIRQLANTPLESNELAPVPRDTDMLLQRGSAWSYFDEGKLPDPAWMQPEFEDRLWFRGPASLGYGDDPKTAVGFGPDTRKKYITTYFRTRFDVADPDKIKGLVLRLQRDDGVVVYLNGTEVWRDNMPKGTIANGTLAVDKVDQKDEERFVAKTVEEVSLKKGANVVAVELHQSEATSSDLRFDLEIAGLTTPRAVTGAEIPVATFAEKFKAFGIPVAVQAEFWNGRVEQFLKSEDPAKAAEALQQAMATGTRDQNDPRTLRLRALIAAAENKQAEASRLYAAAMDGMLQQAAGGKAIDAALFPGALREAGLVLQQTPANFAFAFRRFAIPTRSALELNLALLWAKTKAGTDPDALSQVWSALSDNLNQDADALSIAESVLASLPKPAPGAPAAKIKQYKSWLERKEKGLRAAGNKAAADALVPEIKAFPPRDPALSPKLLDLTAYFGSGIFRASDFHDMPLSFFVPLRGAGFDLRGCVHLESGPLQDDQTINTKYKSKFPLEHKGIKVSQKSPAIHFLTSCAWGREARGVEIARFVMHYEDGSEESLPVKFLDDVADQVPQKDEFADAGRVGWRGRIGDRLEEVSELIWKNPHPDKTIKSIDFISAKAKAGPLLYGITLE